MEAQAVAAEAGPLQIKVYKRRWVVLLLYMGLQLFNAMPWMQYIVLADVVCQYYGLSYESVEWTVLVYNATAMVLVIPAAYCLDKYGLRCVVLVGAVLSASGLWLRVLGCWPGYWWATLVGQAVVSAATNFLGSAPSRLAAVWFPANEVSSAVGAAVLGQTGGLSLGCLLAPLAARAAWTPDENLRGLLTLNVVLAVAVTVLLVPVYFLFAQNPPLPPSPAQAAAAAVAPSGNYVKSVRSIIKQPSFILLLVCFNIIISVYSALMTVLKRDVMLFHPDRSAETGFVATLVVLMGMVGTMVFSILLDKTKKFKELSVVSYSGGLATVVLYSVCIATTSMEVLYVICAFMGAFITSYFIPCYETAVELTFPEPEGNPASILNWFMQPSCIVATLVYSRLFSAYGPHAAHGLLVGLMVVGFVAQLCIPKRYLRREAGLALAKGAGVDKPLMKDTKY